MPSRLGTCSWSEKSWVGPFYPARMKAGDFLAHYATQFDTVEADTTYYAVPAPAVVRRWAEVTPPGFVMSCKLARDAFLGEDARQIDPARVLQHAAFGEPLNAFSTSVANLGPKLGPVVIQCPWFRPEVFRDLAAFLARLDPFIAALPAGPRYVVEVRNRGWLHAELLDVLRTHRAALCLAEVRGMPHPADVAEKLELRTTDFFYARLIGDRSAVERLTKTFDKLVLDKSASLDRWAGLIKVMGQDSDGFVYVNNHFAGHGPETVRQLAARLSAGH
ncbi:MAG: DUF72 domain-containing protein [Planctomycetota bacterium]